MAVIGGAILVIIGAIFLWIALMDKFQKIGGKVLGKVDKTFREEAENYKKEYREIACHE